MLKRTIILLSIIIFSTTVFSDVVVTLEDLGERVPIASPISGFDSDSNSYIDPFENDPILFTVTSNNYSEFSENLLTDGQIAMFKTYPETFNSKNKGCSRVIFLGIEIL